MSVLAAVALAGCAHARLLAPAAPDRAAVAAVVTMAAQQVRACYRPPNVERSARYVTTTLRVRYAIDGALLGLPELVRQSGVTESNAADAQRMLEAARRAVISCTPLRLPPALHARGWDEFDLTFSRRAVA